MSNIKSATIFFLIICLILILCTLYFTDYEYCQIYEKCRECPECVPERITVIQEYESEECEPEIVERVVEKLVTKEVPVIKEVIKEVEVEKIVEVIVEVNEDCFWISQHGEPEEEVCENTDESCRIEGIGFCVDCTKQSKWEGIFTIAYMLEDLEGYEWEQHIEYSCNTAVPGNACSPKITEYRYCNKTK